MTEQQTSITGALQSEGWRVWIPHQPTDNETAIAAVLRHMRRDALQPSLMHERTGPIKGDEACGNFFMASAGFQIYNLTADQRGRLLAAWQEHKESRQYHIVIELNKLAEQIKEAESKCPKLYPNEAEVWKSKARGQFLPRVKQLEAELESIYRG